MWVKAFDIDTRTAVKVATYDENIRYPSVYSFFPESTCPFYMEGKRYIMCGWKYVLWFEIKDGYRYLHFKRYTDADDLFDIGQQVTQYVMGSDQEFHAAIEEPVYDYEQLDEHKFRRVTIKGGDSYRYGVIRTPWWVRR